MLALLCGCHVPTATEAGLPIRAGRASLLYDPAPDTSAPSPTAFADRPEWPSTPGRYEVYETLYYRETVVDHQRASSSGYNDLSYRRFHVRREGVAYR